MISYWELREAPEVSRDITMPPLSHLAVSASNMQKLFQSVQALQETVDLQKEPIHDLWKISSQTQAARQGNPIQTLNSLPVLAFTQKYLDCSSTKSKKIFM